jgi:hypothetical protein
MVCLSLVLTECFEIGVEDAQILAVLWVRVALHASFPP